MPELKCTVQTCVHNQQYLCALDKIQVGGDNAKNPQETCCDSFQERKDGTYSNSVQLSTARRQTVCTMNSVNVMQERSV